MLLRYDEFIIIFRRDPPQDPPTEIADDCSNQVLRRKKLSTLMIDPPNLKILFHTSHNDKEGRFKFVLDPPQHPPVEIVDPTLLGQKIKRKKVSTLIDSPKLKILFHTSHNDKEGRFEFVLEPPQPPPVEIVDCILLDQKIKMLDEILVEHPNVLIQPIKVKLSHFHFDASSSL